MVKRNIEPEPEPEPEPKVATAFRGRRAVQAEQTRLEILGAARRRFAAAGYASTSLKDIAADAGVSVQTVYDSVGSKSDLVRRLNDLIDAEAQVGEIVASLFAIDQPAAVVRIPAKITRRLVERCGDIVRASLDSARAESELADIAAEGNRRHRAGAAAVAGRLGSFGALRDGLTPETATITIAALSDARLAFALIDDHGLSPDEVEVWIGDTTERAVLRVSE